MRKLVADHGNLPDGPRTETAGEGLHLIFKQPDGVQIGNAEKAHSPTVSMFVGRVDMLSALAQSVPTRLDIKVPRVLLTWPRLS